MFKVIMEASYQKKFWLLAAGLFILRLLLAPLFSLVPQEAYYWMYSEKLDIGYFDHPPMVAYSIRAFTEIFGDNELGVRFGTMVFSLGSMFLLFRLASVLYDQKTAFWAVVFLNLTIFFNIHSLTTTPDSPLLFFWLLTMGLFYKALNTKGYAYWILMGIAVGLALFSKYSGVFLYAMVGLFLLVSKEHRKLIFSPKPYVALIASVITFSPVIYWNYANGWASFLFQSSTRAEGMRQLKVDYFGQLIASQLYELTPLFFIGFILVGIKMYREFRQKSDFSTKYSAVFSWPMIIFFFLVSFTSLVKMNWILPAYLILLAPFAYYFKDRLFEKSTKGKWFRAGAVFSLILILLNIFILIVPTFPIKKGDSWNGWQELAAKVSVLEKEMSAKNKTFIFSNEYKAAAELAFYSPFKDKILTQNVLGEKALQFDWWQNPNEYRGQDALLVAADFNKEPDEELLAKHFERVERLPDVEVKHRGMVFRRFYLYKCYNYKGTATTSRLNPAQ